MTNHSGSRTERYEKQRRDTKKINRLILLAVLLIILLIGFIVFGGSDDETDVNDEQNNEENNVDGEDEQNNDDELNDEDVVNDENEDGDDQNNSEGTTDENEGTAVGGSGEGAENIDSDDPNVLNVIVEDWPVLQTEQEEPHIIDLNQDSLDRQEMELAMANALNVTREQLIYWWFESGGIPDRIVGTVEDRQTSEVYRVYLNWITNEGWKPNRVEILIENDSPSYLQSNSSNESEQDEEEDNE